MFKRFIKYYSNHKLLFALDMICSMFISIIGIMYPILTRKMLNDYIPNNKIKYLMIAGLILLIVYVCRMMLRYFVNFYGHMMGVKMQAQMRKELFCHLEKLPYSFYDNNETGKIMTRMTSDLFEASELAHHGPENFFISGLTIIISLIYLAFINIYLTLIIFAIIPVMVIVSLKLRKKMRRAFMETRVRDSEINSTLESSISGIRVTKAFTNSTKEIEKFDFNNNNFVNAKRKSYNAMAKFVSTTGLVVDLFNVIILIAGGVFLYNRIIDFADFSAFVVSIGIFITPLTSLINFIEQFENGASGFKRFCEIMDIEEEKDAPDAKNYTIEGTIDFSKVSFTYDEEKGILDCIDLHINKGEVLALVGPSGGGKTTICHLIPRFYNVNSGVIKIDDVSIDSFKIDSLRKQIGIVQQDVFLFNGTIKENILYGKLDSTDEEVISAAKKANIHEYIMSLPNKYNTLVGERGIKLSGGQKQRLSIARVFLKDPKILILDEATSALDTITEINIQNALNELCKGRTTIVVAHRLSTVKNADRICVISNGKIIEEGTHSELILMGGAYSNLYNNQFKQQV